MCWRNQIFLAKYNITKYKNVPDKTERFLKVLKLHFTLIAGIKGFGLCLVIVESLFGYISRPCPCRILFVVVFVVCLFVV